MKKKDLVNKAVYYTPEEFNEIDTQMKADGYSNFSAWARFYTLKAARVGNKNNKPLDFSSDKFRGDLLKKKREEKGWNKQELANKIGCSRITIFNLERGARGPSRRLAFNLAIALGLPDNYLFQKQN